MTGALQLQPPRIPFPPSIIQPEEERIRKHTAEAALRAEAASELGWGEGRGGRKGTSKREHYLLEVFKFIAQMMFLISTKAIN